MVLFSVFSRYGDGVIAFKVINEFLARHPDKAHYILTSHQLRPYAEALVDRRARVLSVRKLSPHQMLRTVWRLKQAQIDVGFNPWGSRGNSEFFITYAKRFHTLGSIKFAVTDNLYARVRRYLGLPQPEAGAKVRAALPSVRCVLVSPFSTDGRKSLPGAEVGALLKWLKHKFPWAQLTMALAEGEEHRVVKFHNGEWFFFRQERGAFPGIFAPRPGNRPLRRGGRRALHLADALGKPCLGLFGAHRARNHHGCRQPHPAPAVPEIAGHILRRAVLPGPPVPARPVSGRSGRAPLRPLFSTPGRATGLSVFHPA